MSATLQREHWNGQPTHLGDLFRVSKSRGDKQLQAVCELWTHNVVWEMRLEINGIFGARKSSARRTKC